MQKNVIYPQPRVFLISSGLFYIYFTYLLDLH
nr:MAG TPA: CCSMST1 family protein [Caudoviricetes sp.]